MSRLYVTKSAFAAFLILVIGTTSTAYPLLPRHFTIAATLTIGIPTFFLALAPSSGPWRPHNFGRNVARFAVPAGTLTGVGVVASYLFALHNLDYDVHQSRTIATTVLIIVGLYLVVALEAFGSARRRHVIDAMCSALLGVYAVVLALPATRDFFDLAVPTVGMVVTAVAGAALSMVGLYLSGIPDVQPRGERTA